MLIRTLTVLILAAPAPASTVATWRTAVRLLPYLLPPVLLAGLGRVVSYLYRGRDISWLQAAYLYPTGTLLLAVTSAAGLTVVAVRLTMLLRTRPAGRG